MPNILVVDDQPYLREILAQTLAPRGYCFNQAGDAESIRQFLTRQRPDLALGIHRLNGFEHGEVFQDIRRLSPQIPVLIASAYEDVWDAPSLPRGRGCQVKCCGDFETLTETILAMVPPTADSQHEA